MCVCIHENTYTHTQTHRHTSMLSRCANKEILALNFVYFQSSKPDSAPLMKAPPDSRSEPEAAGASCRESSPTGPRNLSESA